MQIVDVAVAVFIILLSTSVVCAIFHEDERFRKRKPQLTKEQKKALRGWFRRYSRGE